MQAHGCMCCRRLAAQQAGARFFFDLCCIVTVDGLSPCRWAPKPSSTEAGLLQIRAVCCSCACRLACNWSACVTQSIVPLP